ncbi:MAG TPA: type II toxin-antitoxin system RelE/ParE family toxin [Flavisolibacter sp.]|nr:type II toxin-antitoxin system RelE/ParE family toxin [Flavisolibacter sp.]
MVKPTYQIVWTTRSQQHLKQAFNFISKDSLQNAEKVINAIVAGVEKAATNPEHYGKDKYKKNNDGTYRAFEKYHYRVSYRFAEATIRILRVRHTSMEPKAY